MIYFSLSAYLSLRFRFVEKQDRLQSSRRQDTQETKLPTYWNSPFSKICLGMKIGQQINFIVINKQANSLYSLTADGQYRATSLGRNTWRTLIGSQASLQRYCDKEGFNALGGSGGSKARIGFLGNNQNDCDSCNSRIGFGSGGDLDDSNTCGNNADPSDSPDNGGKNIKAMGYILIQWHSKGTKRVFSWKELNVTFFYKRPLCLKSL